MLLMKLFKKSEHEKMESLNINSILWRAWLG